MKILAVTHAVPSRLVTNDDVCERLRSTNASRFGADELAGIENRVRRFLEQAGTRERWILAADERAIDIALTAARAALASVGAPVDFVIFAGVARGWLDPAMAHVFAHELGLEPASCFDVVDGCASWLRALEVSEALLRTDRYQTGLILNCECGVERYSTFRLETADDLEPRLAMFTIGEAATATVVTKDPAGDFTFAFQSHPAHYRLAMLALDTMPTFLHGEPDPRCQPLQFFALSRELIPIAARKVVDLFAATPVLHTRPHAVCFTHAANERGSQLVMKKMGIPWERHVSTHPSFGNTIAASLPLAMSIAIRDGRLRRDDGVLAIAASAGITVGFGSFRF